MSSVNNLLSNLTSAGKDRKRVGRGGARGGTSGKGHKGQKARSGPHLGVVFEGGQMPLTRRLPKRGFNNANFKKVFEIVNIETLENSFSTGETVNKEILFEKNIVKNINSKLKVLGNGLIEKKLIVHADAFSKSAADAIKSKGGEVHLIQPK